MSAPRTIVAGGGLMGLACAYEAARVGRQVLLFDTRATGTRASWASAGILTHRGTTLFQSPFRKFQVQSIEGFPRWLAEISTASGIPCEVERGGAWHFFNLDRPDGPEDWQKELDKLKREGSQGFEIHETLPAAIQPLALPGDYRGVWFPREAHVNNRQLLPGLRAACLRLGVEILENARLRELEAGERIRLTLETAAGLRPVEADHLVVAAGAWSGAILEMMGLKAPLVPVRGQMFSIPRPWREDWFLHFHDALYLVPRGEELMVGVTTEPDVMEEAFVAEGETFLRRILGDFLPNLVVDIRERWAGIRPRTRDRLPLLGRVNESGSVLVCAGHYKSGIGMAPLSAHCIGALLAGEQPPELPPEFDPRRAKKGLKPMAAAPAGATMRN